MDLASQLLVCLTAVGVCAGLVRWIRLPLPLVQTLAGVLLAWPLGMSFELDPHAFLLVLIPPLLYTDAWRISKVELRQNRRTILMMAFGLVVITVLAVGLLLSWLVPAIPQPVGFAIAAALSPTDAVAVSGITGRIAVPPRLMTILQGEALFNDASGLVSMRVAVAAMLTGAFSWGHAIGSFFVVAAGGIAVGVVLTWLFVRFMRIVLGDNEGDAGPRILLMLVFPYAAYLAAESMHLSGILAAVAAGLVTARFHVMDPDHRTTRLQGSAVLHSMELALNGLVFVLLGLQLPMIVKEVDAIAVDARVSHAHLALTIACVIGGLVAVRFAWVWLSLRWTLRRAPSSKPSLRIVAATAVAGVRGAVTLAAALTLPLTLVDGSKFPAREVAIFICAVVIIVWLVGASALLPMLLRGVQLPPQDTSEIQARVRVRLANAAIAALSHEPPSAAVDHVIELYRARLGDGSGSDRPDVERRLRAIAIAAERAALREMRPELDEETFNTHFHQLDLIEEALAPGH
jgi:monovalent cation/hydrogen antiporter